MSAGPRDPSVSPTGLTRAPSRRRLPRATRTTALLVLGVAVSGVCLWVALRQASLDEVWASLTGAEWVWILPSLGLTYLTLLVRAVRWRFLFLEPGRVSSWESAKAINVGLLFGTLLPTRAGDIPRIFALSSRTGVSKVEAGGTIVVERALDLLAVAVAALILWPWLPTTRWVQALVALCAVIVVCVVVGGIAVCVLRERARLLTEAVLGRIPYVSAERAATVTASFARGVQIVARPRRLALALGLSAVVWIVAASSVYALFPAFDLPLSWTSAWLITIATSLALTVPSTSGGLGVYEAAVQASLVVVGVSASEALAFAFVLHAINVVPISITGALATLSAVAHATERSPSAVRAP